MRRRIDAMFIRDVFHYKGWLKCSIFRHSFPFFADSLAQLAGGVTVAAILTLLRFNRHGLQDVNLVEDRQKELVV